jgi:hypothetical protein
MKESKYMLRGGWYGAASHSIASPWVLAVRSSLLATSDLSGAAVPGSYAALAFKYLRMFPLKSVLYLYTTTRYH